MPDPNLSERLAEIEARVEAATEGPWEQDGPWILGGVEQVAEGYDDKQGLKDTEFIAAAREDIPWLLEQVREAREALTYYAERRNHTTECDGAPYLWTNDSYDGNGPGARARAALTDSDCPQQSRQEAPGGESVGEGGQ